jgi:hypothetical protein
MPITLSDSFSGERHKPTNTQIRTSCKKQPGFATQSPRKRPFAALPRNDAMGQFLPHAPAAKNGLPLRRRTTVKSVTDLLIGA